MEQTLRWVEGELRGVRGGTSGGMAAAAGGGGGPAPISLIGSNAGSNAGSISSRSNNLSQPPSR